MLKKNKKRSGKGQHDDNCDHRTYKQGKSCQRGSGARLTCRCRSIGVSYVVKGIGRCLFVSCYPVIQCFGLDESRHQSHIHRHFY